MPAHHETDPQFDALGAAISGRTPPPAVQIEARVAAALAECDALEINPLCSTEHAEKLIRQDAREIVASLAEWLTNHQFV